MEAMDLYGDYQSEMNDHTQNGGPMPTMPPLMLAYQVSSSDDYIAKMIDMIKSSEMEQTLLVLPFDYVIRLLEILKVLLSMNKLVESMCRVFVFLIEVHYGPLSASIDNSRLIAQVRDVAQEKLKIVKDCVGLNQAALRYQGNKITEREMALEMFEAVDKVKKKRAKRKNQDRALKTALLTL